MAVPAHDSRDYAFAKHFGLEIRPLVEGCDVSEESFDAKEGIVCNSPRPDVTPYCDLSLNGLTIKEAIAAEQEEDTGKKSSVTLRLRRAENSQDNLDVDMTGTGIDKTKREAKTKRLLKMKNNVLDSNKKDDKDKPKE